MTAISEAEVLLALGRLEGKMDAILQMQRIQEEQLKGHDKRIRDLEHSRSFFMGASALAGAGASLSVSLLTKVFQ